MDKGLKTLLALYKNRPRDEIGIPEDEIALAKEQGYLFDYPEYESHSDTFSRLQSVLSRIDPKDIASVRIVSLFG